MSVFSKMGRDNRGTKTMEVGAQLREDFYDFIDTIDSTYKT